MQHSNKPQLIQRIIQSSRPVVIKMDGNGKPYSCSHDQGKVLRWRTLSNHARVLTYQCSVCGRALDSVKKATIPAAEWDSIQEWDVALEQSYQDANSRAWEKYRINWRDRIAAEAADAEQAIRARYAAYLQSPQWRYRRSLRLTLDNHQCQARLNECAGRANEVHHLTYAHIGNEPLFDLVSVCSSCHRQISEKEGRLRNEDVA